MWSEDLGKYICSDDAAFQKAMADQSNPAMVSAEFKLVFLTAVGGTLFFVIICVATTLIAGKEPPALLEKTVTSLFDLAKIGFGAVVGLLGAQKLKG